MSWDNTNRARTSSREHVARRKRVLARDGHRCQIRGPRCIGTANYCDHIRNVASFANPADAETDENCQAACKPCHDQKSAGEGVSARATNRARLKLPPEPHPGLLR
ncbi:HNH endonuclease [Aldersonia kunmingensis]|uniref:HNH endonuclease n=1 Tax=Aldersonia kunmingensis TaxID=408066 RepID=UPI000834C07C|nr:HNH endonuclease [Aldersonia kunmingensis]